MNKNEVFPMEGNMKGDLEKEIESCNIKAAIKNLQFRFSKKKKNNCSSVNDSNIVM